MDDIVKKALLKWPSVPACYGWLGLDSRGNWFMRDEQAQSQGAFSGGTLLSKGSELKHEKLIEFIGRNYDVDDRGQWFFQNGPQRVYIELELTPLIWRVERDFSVKDHVGRSAAVKRCVMDELGYVYLDTTAGFGLIHTSDMNDVAHAIDQGIWTPEAARRKDFELDYGYCKSPEKNQKK